LKYQIAQQFANCCKELLPPHYNIGEILSLQDRIRKTRKLALFHIHKCDHTSENPCKLLAPEIEHKFKNINEHYFKESFKHFAPTKWINITLDLSLFNKN